MSEKLKVLDLFSGIGGFSLGLERTGGFETVAFCEIDPFCQKVLKKHWPDIPICNDVRTLDYDGAVDVITGGYPCQPFSTAGRRKGQDDDRHLWPAMLRLIQKHRPTWVIGENVAGHVSMGLDDVLSDLESQGYGARTFIIPAIAVDAKHRRDRVWTVANSQSQRKRGRFGNVYQEDGGQGGSLFQQLDGTGQGVAYPESERSSRLSFGTAEEYARPCRTSEDVPNATSIGQSRPRESIKQMREKKDGQGKANITLPIRERRKWPVEPNVGRVANGVSRRVDRLRSLGNAVVPQIPEMIGYAILEAEKEAT